MTNSILLSALLVALLCVHACDAILATKQAFKVTPTIDQAVETIATMKQVADASPSMQGEFAVTPSVRVSRNRPWEWKCTSYYKPSRCVLICSKCCWVRYYDQRKELCKHRCHVCVDGSSGRR